MKKNLFILLMFVGLTASAQFSWTKAVVSLNDGSTMEGEARLIRKGSGFNKTARTVQYRAAKGDKKETYSSREVKSIIFSHDFIQKIDGMPTEQSSVDTFLPIDVKKHDNPVFLQEVIKDDLSLYAMPVKNYKLKISSTAFPLNMGQFSIIYIKKSNTSARQVTVLGLEGKIQDRKVADYLSDCPLMLEYIKDENGNMSAVDIVNHYNANCSS